MSKPWYMENYKQKFSEKNRQRILPAVESALADEMRNRNSRRDIEHFHASEMAKANWCPRSTWYKMKETPESDPDRLNLRRLNILTEGNNIHDKWQRWMWKAGCLYGEWGCGECDYRFWATSPTECLNCLGGDLYYREVPLYNEEYHMLGHADGIWEDADGQALVEIKSVGLGTLRWDAPQLYQAYADGDLDFDGLWKQIKRPLASHIRQASLYMFALGLTEAVIIYEWKPDQDVKEFRIKLDMDRIQGILDKVKETIPLLDGDEPPSKPHNAFGKKSEVCRFCNYKSKCWNGKSDD